MNLNRFAALDDEAPAKTAGAEKKQAQKPAERVVQREVFGAPRQERPQGEGRGQRGRGNRGGRGDRPQTEGEDRPRGRGQRGRGDRGGRGGRGGRGRGRVMEQGDDVVQFKQPRGDGKEHRHEGRPDKHEGHDRRPGTGRGRGARKEGHGKGNWGKAGEENKNEEGAPAVEGEQTEKAEKVEKEEKKVEPEPESEYDIKKRQIREEEEKVKTLADYQKERKVAGIKAQMREADKFNEKNVKEDGNAQDDRKTTIDSNLLVYNAGQNRNEHASLLAFQAAGDEEFEERRGGRGGRGGRGRGDRAPADGARRGGRGGKMKMNDSDFPSLS